MFSRLNIEPDNKFEREKVVFTGPASQRAISRRTCLARIIGFAGCWLLAGARTSFGAMYPHFFFSQIKYRGGEWDPNPMYTDAIAEELEIRTSIDATRERRIIEAADSTLFYSPFLYMAGRYDFEPFSDTERAILKRYLTHGGFLLAEDTIGAAGFGFDRAFRREISRIFPDDPLRRLSPDHSVYQSFYLINSVAGRLKIHPYLEGITIKNWTPVIYSQNDLSGAWSRDRYGKWVHDCVPGGDQQRKTALKAGINLVVYSLTADYKRDLVHHPFIKRRQNL